MKHAMLLPTVVVSISATGHTGATGDPGERGKTGGVVIGPPPQR